MDSCKVMGVQCVNRWTPHTASGAPVFSVMGGDVRGPSITVHQKVLYLGADGEKAFMFFSSLFHPPPTLHLFL